ncbi:MAG: hypothetical protein R8P61_14730 [Bacteroidia bacterium]|nr:hypothetical protein [Bacteroidia bacterium]
MPSLEFNDFVTAILTAVGTLALFLLKERIDRNKERKSQEQERLSYFKAYTDPLRDYCYSLQKRLYDIFKYKARFVDQTVQHDEFQNYQYISTLYRFCAVLGWIRAVNRELAGVELGNAENYKNLKQALKKFEKALTNKEVDSSRLEYLAIKWGLDISSLQADAQKLKSFCNELDQALWQELILVNQAKKQKEGEMITSDSLQSLSKKDQLSVLRSIANKICKEIGQEEVEMQLIEDTREYASFVLARKEAWIYSNWQQAIGDMMLSPSDGSNPNRRFEVMGFRAFESLYLKHEKEDHEDSRWIKRVDALFRNLKVRSISNSPTDARIPVLKELCECLLILIESLERLDGEPDKKTRDKLDQLSAKTQEVLNGNQKKHEEEVSKLAQAE